MNGVPVTGRYLIVWQKVPLECNRSNKNNVVCFVVKAKTVSLIYCLRYGKKFCPIFFFMVFLV